jgi:L-aminopeptidase/D-esterase-like protein
VTAEGAVVGAIAVVNSWGDVVDPRTGKILAGARSTDGKGFLDMETVLLEGPPKAHRPLGSTTLGVVATDAVLTKTQATKVAQMAQDGLARAIRPAHTPFDGDLVFALSAGDRIAEMEKIGALASRVLAEAIVRAVRQASSLHGVSALKDLQ